MLTASGRAHTLAIAGRLDEELQRLKLKAGDVAILRADSPESTETARVLVQLLETGVVHPIPTSDLDPLQWDPKRDLKDLWNKLLVKARKNGDTPRMLILVGHDPQMSWLLHELATVEQKGAGPLPLERGAMAMLRTRQVDKRGLVWVLSPPADEAIGELQAKIKSKMDTAKLLGAFLTGLLIFAARSLVELEYASALQQLVAGLGLTLLAVATVGYFVTMFQYDSLLMPVRFWPSKKPTGEPPLGMASRPPSSAAWVLYQNMMRIWRNAFIPATVSGGFGSGFVAIALVWPEGRWWWAGTAVAILVVAASIFAFRSGSRPLIGVSD